MASIEKRGEESWRITVGRIENGVEVKYRRTFKGGRRDAERAAVDFEAEINRGNIAPSTGLRVAEFAQLWLDDHVRVNLVPKTQVAYKQHLNDHILPFIGAVKLKDLKPVHISRLYASLQGLEQGGHRKGHLSAKTLSNIAGVLNRMLNDAVRWGYIPFNPAGRVERPRKLQKEAVCYDDRDIEALLTALSDLPPAESKYRVIVYIALFTGMRLGEIMGLEWSDVDLVRSRVSVRRISQYVTGQGVITKAPKTKKSTRTITIPVILTTVLKQYQNEWMARRNQLDDLWRGTERLFATDEGEAMHPLTPSKWWARFVTRAQLPPMNFHGLRHSSATYLFQNGANIEAVSARLGHRDATTFLKVYSHLFRSSDEEASAVFDNIIPLKAKAR